MRKGRSTVYPESVLITRIMEYYRSNRNEKIRIADLVKATGISRNTWYRCEAAMNKIDDLNGTSGTPIVSDSNIPTITEIRQRCGNDIKEYTIVISQLLDIIAERSKHNATIDNDEALRLQEENKNLKKINRKLNDRLNTYLLEDAEKKELSEITAHMNQASFDKLFGEFFDD